MKVKHLFLFCFPVFMLFSCAAEKKDRVSLYNGTIFSLMKDEKTSELFPKIKDRYARHFNNAGKIQVPLYKYVGHPDYDIFIGIPVNTTMQELSSAYQTENGDSTIAIYSDSLTFYKQARRDSLYITTYITSFGANTLLCLFGLTHSETTADTVFNKSSLSGRFQK